MGACVFTKDKPIIDRFPVASIPSVMPTQPIIEPNDADYRKRIIEAVLKFRAQQTPTTTKEKP